MSTTISGNNLFNITFILDKLKVEERQSVGELGCGNFGFFVWPLAKLVGRYGLVFAVDVVKSILEEIDYQAKTDNLPQIKTVWTNLEIFKATKIETSSLDSALLINTLHQAKNRTEMLREAIRLLKRGGKLLIVEWQSKDIPFGPSLDKRVKIESLKSVISKLGLNVAEEFKAGPYHYGLILTKL